MSEDLPNAGSRLNAASWVHFEPACSQLHSREGQSGLSSDLKLRAGATLTLDDSTPPLRFIKAHAYGNDFLVVPHSEVEDSRASVLAQQLCDRHRGIGADGLILHERDSQDAAMRLLNGDGSYAEISGNGMRCLAAILVREGRVSPITINTAAGARGLELLAREGQPYTFRAAMGRPEHVPSREVKIGE